MLLATYYTAQISQRHQNQIEPLPSLISFYLLPPGGRGGGGGGDKRPRPMRKEGTCSIRLKGLQKVGFKIKAPLDSLLVTEAKGCRHRQSCSQGHGMAALC